MKRISQREARRLRKQLSALTYEVESQRRRWSAEYVNSVEIARATWTTDMTIPTAIITARSLGHAVVALGDDTGLVRFIALPHPKVWSHENSDMLRTARIRDRHERR